MGDCPANSKVDGDTLSSTNLTTTWNQEFNAINSTDTTILKKNNMNLSIYVDYLASITSNPPTIPDSVITSLQTSSPKYLLSLSDFQQLLTFYTAASPPATSDSTRQELEQRNSKLISHIAKEYTFYSCRYKSILTQYTSVYSATSDPATTQFGYAAATTSGATTASAKTNTLNTIANRAAQVGRKLTLLNALLQKIGASMTELITRATGSANTTALETAITALNASAPTTNEIAQLEAQRRAIQYTQEKNRYSNLYLGIYAFLNITALAVLLHIAGSE